MYSSSVSASSVSILLAVAGSRVPLSVVRSCYPTLPAAAQEILAADVTRKCSTAVEKGSRPSPGVPVDVWLRGFARRVAESRDVVATAHRLRDTLSIDALLGHDALAWSSPSSDPGWADDDDVDEAVTLFDRMPQRWQASVHGRAISLGVGLGLPRPVPVWDPGERTRLARLINSDPHFAARDLAAYGTDTSDRGLAPVWRSLGADGRRAVSMRGLPPSSADEVAAVIALDRVTMWPRPRKKLLSNFTSAVQRRAPADARSAAVDAALVWLAVVFEPQAIHGVRSTAPLAPAPDSASALSAFSALASSPGHPMGDTPDAVASWLASLACHPPHNLHVAAMPSG